jgi:hypothetical protein
MSTAISPFHSFAAGFAGLIPPGLRTSAAALSRREFLDRYCPANGPVRLGAWSQHPGPRGTHHFDATIGIGPRIRTVHVDAIGPIAALSGALHEAGYGIEILSFHQQKTAEGTVTFVHCEHDGRRHWAMGIADNDTDSALRSMVAAANLLSRS